MAFDPLSLAARVELTLAYWAEGDFHRSLKEANDAVFSGQTLERKSASSNTTLVSPEQKEIGGFSSAHYARSVVLAELGELDEAFEEARQAADVGGRMAANLGWLGHVCAKRGDANGALRIIAELLGRASRGKHVATALATVYVGLGDAANALKYLEQALEAREVNLVFVRHSRHFAELHAEPRFQKLLSSMRGGEERQ